MTKDEAESYINFNIKEGTWEPEMFEGWSDKKLIKFAEYQVDRADRYYNDNQKSD